MTISGGSGKNPSFVSAVRIAQVSPGGVQLPAKGDPAELVPYLRATHHTKIGVEISRT